MIRYLEFRDGAVKKGNNLNYGMPKKDNYLLIFLTRPTETEIKKIIKDFRIDPEPLNKYTKETHSRRYITKPFQFVMRSTFLEKDVIGYANLLFILMNRVLIVSVSKPSEFYEEIMNDLSEVFAKTKVRSVGHILYSFLQEDVDENYDVLGKIEQRIRDVEAKASKTKLNDSRMSVDDILSLKRQLFRMSRQFWATTRVVSLIRIGVAQVVIDKESERMLGDVHETFLHQIDVAAAQKEMVSDVLNVYSTTLSNMLAISSNELNIIMKKVTSYATLVLIPTLVAGVYGMNFKYIPLAEMKYGFAIIIGIMAVMTALALANFIKNDWL
ncbi:MAG: magnesium transporter CorA family protein [archaeon]